MKIYVLYFFQVPYFWKGGMYFRCTYWLYSEDFCTLSLEISSIPSRRCGQVADNADASQGNRPLTVTPLTKATEWSRVDISDLAIYNPWKWSISHGKISFVLSVEKGGVPSVSSINMNSKWRSTQKTRLAISQNNFGQIVAKVPQPENINLETITYYQNLCKKTKFWVPQVWTNG